MPQEAFDMDAGSENGGPAPQPASSLRQVLAGVGTLVTLAFVAFLAVRFGVFTPTPLSPNIMYKKSLASAQCLDGTPAAYYFADSTSLEHSAKYVIFLEGGGLCDDSAGCEKRKQTAMGSSKDYPETLQPGQAGTWPSQEPAGGRGILLGDNDHNPGFGTWHRIFVRYCSGDGWAGTMTTPTNPFGDNASWTGIFSGHNILDAVIKDLKASHGAEDATDIILAGCSAGGIGTFANCDFVAESFPKSTTACRSEAGLFGLPRLSQKEWEKDPKQEPKGSTIAWLKEVSPQLPQHKAVEKCQKETTCPASFEGECCETIPYFYPYIKTRMFISQSTMDSLQLVGEANFLSVGVQPPAAYIEYFALIVQAYFEEQRDKSGGKFHSPQNQDGLFAFACYVHCPVSWTATGIIDGKNDMQAFWDWYYKQQPKKDDRCRYYHLDKSTVPHANCETEPRQPSEWVVVPEPAEPAPSSLLPPPSPYLPPGDPSSLLTPPSPYLPPGSSPILPPPMPKVPEEQKGAAGAKGSAKPEKPEEAAGTKESAAEPEGLAKTKGPAGPEVNV